MAGRPVVLVMLEGHEIGGEPREIAAFFASLGHPRLADKTNEVSPRFLLKMLSWIENELPVDES
jgi:hypothetical protein